MNYIKNDTIVQLMIVGFFVFLGAKWTTTVSFYALHQDGWVVGDWLINYSSGFVRRGLSGSLILIASNFLSVNPASIVKYLQITLYYSFLWLLLVSFLWKQKPGWFLILLFSPATLTFPIYSEFVTGRKEVIFFCILAGFVYALHKRIITDVLAAFFGICVCLAILAHELIVFYVPYFVGAAYLVVGYEGRSRLYRQVGYICLAAVLTAGIITMLGQTLHGDEICVDLVRRGMRDSICKGILTFPVMNIKGAIVHTLMNVISANYLVVYSGVLLLSSVPIGLFLNQTTRQEAIKVVSVVAFSFAFSSPLFLTAVDWGRFIHIHFVSILILSSLILPERSDLTNLTWAGVATKLKGNIVRRTALYGCGAIVYLTSWSIPVCCYNSINIGLMQIILRRLGAMFL